jgi:hypothetical protein
VRDERRLTAWGGYANVECGVTRMDRIRNEYIRGSLKVALVCEKMRSNRLVWYVMRKDESHITKRVMSMNVDGHPISSRTKKRWMDLSHHSYPHTVSTV